MSDQNGHECPETQAHSGWPPHLRDWLRPPAAQQGCFDGQGRDAGDKTTIRHRTRRGPPRYSMAHRVHLCQGERTKRHNLCRCPVRQVACQDDRKTTSGNPKTACTKFRLHSLNRPPLNGAHEVTFGTMSVPRRHHRSRWTRLAYRGQAAGSPTRSSRQPATMAIPVSHPLSRSHTCT